MADADKQLEKLFNDLSELDTRRQKDPIVGRKADEKMMELCSYLRDNELRLGTGTKQKAVQRIKAMNLRPYWNYCREHLLNIGLEF